MSNVRPADREANMAPTFSQSREFTRIRMRMTARVSAPDRAVRLCPVRDVGLGGIYVETDDCLRTGEICAMQLILSPSPSGPQLQATGRVVRVEPGRGTAIEFTTMSLESFDYLDRHIYDHTSEPEDVEPDFAKPIES